jgi:hypothetical protein
MCGCGPPSRMALEPSEGHGHIHEENAMPKVELDVRTTVPPEIVRAALLDFSDRRPQIWPGIEPSLYRVHALGATSAEIQEGSRMPGGAVWARERYDWSNPDEIRWTVLESNFCAPGSYVSAAIRPAADGPGSVVHLVWNRTATTLQGRIAATMIRLTRGAPVRASFRMAMTRLEAEGSPQVA